MRKKHESWSAFCPLNGEDLANNESYYLRIDSLDCPQIPTEIIHQWIFPHYYEPNTIKNYSWIDLYKVGFNLESFPTSFFESLNIIADNREMVKNYPPSKFATWHRKFWRENGTWQVPPIIIDVESFVDEKPFDAELDGAYQLVEGHNRVGTLLLLVEDEKINVAENHKAWILAK